MQHLCELLVQGQLRLVVTVTTRLDQHVPVGLTHCIGGLPWK